MKASTKLAWMVVASLATGTVALAADAFQVDAVHSSILFKVKHMDVSYTRGRFNEVSGKFLLDESNPERSSFDLSINAESVDTANAKRDLHLKNADFFNAKQFPKITFKSKSVAKTSAGYSVSGDLTLHGVTKPVTIVVTPVGTGKGMRGEAVAGVEASLTIKRSDFGMTYMVGPVGDEVQVTASLEGSHP
jgi:polyisoprenoid-binding protein YceI